MHEIENKLELSSPFFQNDCRVDVTATWVGRARVDDHGSRLFDIGHVKGRHGTWTLHVIADEPLQGGGVDDVEAHGASKRAWLPVLRGADGVSH